MQFLMYATPVVFAMSESGLAANVFILYPITPLILTARNWLTGSTPEYLGYFLGVNAVAFLLLLVSWIGYRLSLPILVERM